MGKDEFEKNFQGKNKKKWHYSQKGIMTQETIRMGTALEELRNLFNS